MPDKEKSVCFIVFEDGFTLPGKSFGASADVDGEIGK